MKCSVEIKADGSLKINNNPELYNELLVYNDGDVDNTLRMYGLTLTPEFQTLGIEKPTVPQLLSYITQLNIENPAEFTLQDRLRVLQIQLSADLNTEDISTTFIEAFTVEGRFGIDLGQIQNSGLFTPAELYEIGDYTEELQDLYHKLYSEEIQINPIHYDFVEGGLFDKTNPDITQDRILREYEGLRTVEEIETRAAELEDEVVIGTEQGYEKVLRMVQNTTIQKVYETDPITQELIPRADDFKSRFLNTVDPSQDYTPLVESIESLTRMIEAQDVDQQFLNDYLPALQDYASELGIDLTLIVDRAYSGDTTSLVEYLSSLLNVLEDVQNADNQSLIESLELHNELHQDMFQDVQDGSGTQVVTEVPGTQLNDFQVETNLTQEELFKRHNIVQVQGNQYRKVPDVPLIDIYTLILNNPGLLKERVFTVAIKPENTDILVKQLEQHLVERSKSLITRDTDIEVLKTIMAHKIVEGIQPTEYSVMIPVVREVDQDKLHLDIAEALRQQPELSDTLYFSATGVQAKHRIGPYTQEMLYATLGSEVYEDLVNYANLTDTLSLRGLQHDATTQTQSGNIALYYLNNPNKLPNFVGNYYQQGEYYIADSTQDVIKIEGQILEQVDDNIYAPAQDAAAVQNYTPGDIQPDFNKINGQVKIETSRKIQDETIEFC